MSLLRIISKIDLKNEFVVKGYHLEGWQKVGNPIQIALHEYENGCDEFIFIDSVASLFSRKKILNIIKELSKKIFVPITVGGGIKNMKDVDEIFKLGADKIAVNTEFIKNPNFIKEISKKYGTQSIVLSVQAKKIKNEWYAFSENARNNSEFIVTEWIKKCENFGVGEILLTSVDNEGCEIGFDVDLYIKVKKITNLPIIAHGGYGSNNDIIKLKNIELSAIAIGRCLHFRKITCNKIKEELKNKGFNFRN